MRSPGPEYHPVNGKTYSLFGKSDSTSGYYETIKMIADKIAGIDCDLNVLIDQIRNFASKKRVLKKSIVNNDETNPMSVILNLIDPQLRKYTENTPQHLRNLSITKFWDRRLATTREQYHLYMLEIELSNRQLASNFRRADRKIALMPYCLQDFSTNCRAEKDGFDYQCRHCSLKCYQNHASRILKSNNIEPFIWMGGDMKQLAKYTLAGKRTLGILGIACIPELTWGMRNCLKNGIPVVGLPLNANCCVRWFGEFFPNSVDLGELERLVVSA